MFLNNIIIILLYLSKYNNAFNPTDYPMCSGKNSSCSYLFGKESEINADFCQMIYYDVNQQTSCDNAYNILEKRNHDIDLGTLVLQPFYGDTRTVFNVSFTNIEFKMLRIRFQMYKDGRRERNRCMVKEFVINGNVASDKTFSYVCPWSEALYEEQEVQFHYDYGIDKYVTRRKYLFTVPKQDFLISDTKMISAFAYIDYSDISSLILTILPLYQQLNISYNVEYICEFKANESKVLFNQTIPSGSYNFDTFGEGNYSFRITLISDYCNNQDISCVVHETPKIRIANELSILLIGMVGGAIFMIPTFAVIIFMWYKKWFGFPKPKPKVLLVSVPTNNAHAIVAPAIAKFLKNTFNIDVLLDIDNVRQGHTDSYQWLKDEIFTCSHIIFLRSNENFDHSKVTYLDTDIQAIDLLNPKFIEERKHECIVTFPFSTTQRVAKLNHVRKYFNFEEDKYFKKLIYFITKENFSVSQITSPEYQELIKAIKLAETEPHISIQKQMIDVVIKVPDENISEQYYPEKMKSENSDFEKQNIDISDFNITGDKEESHSEKSDDSDLDELCLLGRETSECDTFIVF